MDNVVYIDLRCGAVLNRRQLKTQLITNDFSFIQIDFRFPISIFLLWSLFVFCELVANQPDLIVMVTLAYLNNAVA